MKHYYRRPKTTAERRINGSRKDRELCQWSRAKRRSNNLPTLYHDISTKMQKSWKKSRKRQYRGRGKQHGIEVNSRVCEWEIENYLVEHNIPHRLEPIKTLVTKYYRGVSYRYSHQIGTRIIWWADKDIGIDYILKRTRYLM
jgi:hypothetical protein